MKFARLLIKLTLALVLSSLISACCCPECNECCPTRGCPPKRTCDFKPKLCPIEHRDCTGHYDAQYYIT